MRNRRTPNQLMFEGFETEFERWLEPDNRWVLLSRIIPWEELSAAYETSLSAHTGRPAKDGRLVIGAVIIKHKLCLSDEETIEQIRENPYLQYFVGFKAFHKEQAFAPSLFVEIRRRMGPEVFAKFEDSIIAHLSDHQKPETSPDDNQTTPLGGGEAGPGDDAKPMPGDQEPTTHRGKLIVDATVVEQAIRYAKLPRGFLIPTPVGDYNPDWAISFKEGGVKHIYFIAETKGSMSSMKLREIEKTKIECARKFFEEISQHITTDRVKYDVVTDYAKLMDIVGKAA